MSKYQRVVSDFHHGKYFSFRKGHSSRPFLVYEIRGDAIGIPCVVIVRVAVRVHNAEVVAVVVIRRTLPPPSSGTERGKRLPTDRFYRNTPINFHRRLPALIAFQHIGQKTIFCID